MLQSVKELYGKKLEAVDGEIGHVKDFYFDDQSWVVRYVVADTGSWLTGRQTLLSPHAFGGVHLAGKLLAVNLTRKQIEESPSIDSRKPVSRQFEDEYHRFYGWPYYWQGNDLWGMSAFPIVEAPLAPLEGGVRTASGDPHLRSAQAVQGYDVKARDGTTGHVCDFMMDPRSWAIREVVVKTGHRFSGKETLVPASLVAGISYDESVVTVNLTRAAVEQSPGRLAA